MSISVRYLAQFENLVDKLSPENLTCDGELNRTEVNRKYNHLMKDWKQLEKKVGRTVTEEEVWELSRYGNYDKRRKDLYQSGIQGLT